MTTVKKRTPRKPQRTTALLADLVKGTTDLQELAERHGMTMLELARWAGRERYAAILDELERIADRRTSLIVAAGRAAAARALVNLATGATNHDKTKETARKACVDLIKLDRAGAPASPQAAEDGKPTREDVRSALAKLEALGEESDEELEEGGLAADAASLDGSNEEGPDGAD